MFNTLRLCATLTKIMAKNKIEMQEFLDKNGGVAVVDFFATWCGPCMRIAPYVKTQCDTHQIPLIKVDVDQASELAADFNITSMPTFAVVQGKYNNVLSKKIGGSESIVNQMITLAKSTKPL